MNFRSIIVCISSSWSSLLAKKKRSLIKTRTKEICDYSVVQDNGPFVGWVLSVEDPTLLRENWAVLNLWLTTSCSTLATRFKWDGFVQGTPKEAVKSTITLASGVVASYNAPQWGQYNWLVEWI